MQKQPVVQKREKRDPNKTGSQKTVRQLLGELYADKVYLEKLLEDDQKRNFSNNGNQNNNSNKESKDSDTISNYKYNKSSTT